MASSSFYFTRRGRLVEIGKKKASQWRIWCESPTCYSVWCYDTPGSIQRRLYGAAKTLPQALGILSRGIPVDDRRRWLEDMDGEVSRMVAERDRRRLRGRKRAPAAVAGDRMPQCSVSCVYPSIAGVEIA